MNNKTDSDGKTYWRSLEQRAETPEFREFLQREFPQGASELNNAWSRRNFLTLMGASLALAGLVSCRRPEEGIVPYVAPPEEVVPGVQQRYATAMPFGTGAYGVVVESHEGRPTKVEGNRLHPSSRGGTNVFMQAAILDLYDPDRSQRVLRKGIGQQWSDFVAFWRERRSFYEENQGNGLAVLSESFSSPTLARLKREFHKVFPQAKWVTYEPVSDETIVDGFKVATGETYFPLYRFDKAKVILSLDADFLLTESENVTHARDFIDGRRITSEKDAMNRLYAVESCFSLTGAMADHRLRLQSRQVGAFALALAFKLTERGLKVPALDGLTASSLADVDQTWLNVLADDLMRTQGRCLIVAGRRQPAEVHALVLALNEALGNVGNAISFIEPRDKALSNTTDLQSLVNDMQSGQVTTLAMLGGNPVYDAAVDLDFATALQEVAHTIHLSQFIDETSQLAEWHLARTHFLEGWGDARATDGTLSVIQPLIAPLYDSRSSVELLHLVTTGLDLKGYEIVRASWQEILKSGNLEKKWRRVLHDGILEKSQLSEKTARIHSEAVSQHLRENAVSSGSGGANDLEIVFHGSASVFDGRYANNGWLQELPDPITKLSWDNAAVMSPQTASSLNLEKGDMVRLEYRGRELEMPVWIVPGQADYSVAVELGFGRRASGQVGNDVGFNTFTLRTAQAPHFDSGLKLTKTGRQYMLADTQHHGSMEGRPIVREATLDEYRENPLFAREMVEHPPLVSLWKDRVYDKGYQWGMTVDLNACIGCNACTIACQSENNIPIVGKEQVHNGREMHWIRVDRYYTGDSERPQMVHQPIPCQQCENAPCEQVCPVAATSHDREGLNVMVYNRCIGTRYCSNNCPYKVRHFNFFNYTKDYHETIKMAQNPDVTVRSRGVMEKCTYCLQRINEAKRKAKREGRQVADGEILTACQQACPTQAIVFGNINQTDSHVVKMKKQNRNYYLLAELNTKPRTSYLAKLRNPNPELKDA